MDLKAELQRFKEDSILEGRLAQSQPAGAFRSAAGTSSRMMKATAGLCLQSRGFSCKAVMFTLLHLLQVPKLSKDVL